jgi:hypothetical protein
LEFAKRHFPMIPPLSVRNILWQNQKRDPEIDGNRSANNRYVAIINLIE